MKNIYKNAGDVLVSVAISDYSIIDENNNDIARIATDLEREYKFWEILIIEKSMTKITLLIFCRIFRMSALFRLRNTPNFI